MSDFLSGTCFFPRICENSVSGTCENPVGGTGESGKVCEKPCEVTHRNSRVTLFHGFPDLPFINFAGSMLSLQSRTRMSAMPSLNPKIVWFPGPQHALFNSYFKLFQLCRCPWLLSLNQNRAPETSDQAQTHFPRLSKCIWHSIILDFNAVAAHEIAPKMLEFACHAAKTHFALVSANLELNVVRICIGMLKNGCKGPNMHCQGLEGSI